MSNFTYQHNMSFKWKNIRKGKINVKDFANKIQVKLSDKFFVYPANIQVKIDELRNEKIQTAKSLGKEPMRDATKYRMKSLNYEDWVLCFDLQYIWYKNVSQAKFVLEDIDRLLWEDGYTMQVYTNSLIQTTDGYFLFGERSAKYLNRTQWDIDFIGWSLDQVKWKILEPKDIYESLLCELQEEIWIESDNVLDCNLIAVNRSKWMHCWLLFDTKLNLTKDEAMTKFNKNTDNEMQNFKIIESKDLYERITANGKDENWQNISNFGICYDCLS